MKTALLWLSFIIIFLNNRRLICLIFVLLLFDDQQNQEAEHQHCGCDSNDNCHRSRIPVIACLRAIDIRRVYIGDSSSSGGEEGSPAGDVGIVGVSGMDSSGISSGGVASQTKIHLTIEMVS